MSFLHQLICNLFATFRLFIFLFLTVPATHSWWQEIKRRQKPRKKCRIWRKWRKFNGFLLALNGIGFPPPCAFIARPVMGKAHRYLLQSKETGGRWKVGERCQLRKKYHKKTTNSRVFFIEITSHTGECSPFDSFAPCDGTVPRPGALLLHFWDQLRRQDSTFVYEYGGDIPLSNFDETIY